MAQSITKRLKVLKEKYEQLTEWLQNNTRSTDFLKVVSERNDLSVQMEVLKQQITGRWQPPSSYAHKIVINPNVRINEY